IIGEGRGAGGDAGEGGDCDDDEQPGDPWPFRAMARCGVGRVSHAYGCLPGEVESSATRADEYRSMVHNSAHAVRSDTAPETNTTKARAGARAFVPSVFTVRPGTTSGPETGD